MINGSSYPLARRKDSPSHFVNIVADVNELSRVQVVSETTLWEGWFAPSVTHERLAVDEEKGFVALTSVSSQSPATREIPKWAARSWLFLLALFAVLNVHRIRE